MLFIVGIVIALIAFVVIPRVRVPVRVNSANLGWMSEQWLAEHRASHSLQEAPAASAEDSRRQALAESNQVTADHALDLERMDDDGGWQTPRLPA